MRVNTARDPIYTHEGAPARHISALDELKRSVLSCFLWESGFYEDGVEIANRIKSLAHKCNAKDVAELAVYARSEMHLRHVPLLLCRELARHPKREGVRVAQTLAEVIQRADELAEFLALYWLEGKQPLSKQVKLGLAWAFQKFNAYQLAKYNRDNAVKLRDVLFLCHAKPKDKAQEAVWKQLIDGTLPAPDTWEVALSGGADKGEALTRLLKENKLGYMALLRNLRNMEEAGVDKSLVSSALMEGAARSRALPFRFISAAKAAPQYEPQLDAAMSLALGSMQTLPGKTIVLVDVSGSMTWHSSGRSELTMLDRGCALAALVAGIAEDYMVFSFSHEVVQVPPRKGMALIDAVSRSQPHGGTYLGGAVQHMNGLDCDRLIVFTDEQSHDRVPNPKNRGYMVNVASNKRGVGYGPWVHIDGFSENVIRFIQELESSDRV